MHIFYRITVFGSYILKTGKKDLDSLYIMQSAFYFHDNINICYVRLIITYAVCYYMNLVFVLLWSPDCIILAILFMHNVCIIFMIILRGWSLCYNCYDTVKSSSAITNITIITFSFLTKLIASCYSYVVWRIWLTALSQHFKLIYNILQLFTWCRLHQTVCDRTGLDPFNVKEARFFAKSYTKILHLKAIAIRTYIPTSPVAKMSSILHTSGPGTHSMQLSTEPWLVTADATYAEISTVTMNRRSHYEKPVVISDHNCHKGRISLPKPRTCTDNPVIKTQRYTSSNYYDIDIPCDV